VIENDPEIVLDEKDGRGLRCPPYEIAERRDVARRQALRRLVEHQQGRSERQAHGKLEQALMAIGKHGCDTVRLILEADGGKSLIDRHVESISGEE